MNDAEIKLKLFRFIDSQDGNQLKEIYNLVREKFDLAKLSRANKLSDIEVQYKQMAEDMDREKDAIEWIGWMDRSPKPDFKYDDYRW
jgi:hypothetical protein